MPRRYHNETKAMLIARLEAYESAQGVDLGRMDEGLAALDAVAQAISTTNVANFGLKAQVHDRWKRELAGAQAILHAAIGGS